MDPDSLFPPALKAKFYTLHKEYNKVFDPSITNYNGAAGLFDAKVNMGPVKPPQRKGHLPQYECDKLNNLQQMLDSLERLGVFKKPEEVGVTVEYLNPSFVVKNAPGDYCLVTAFPEVGRYSKSQLSILPCRYGQYATTNCVMETYHCHRSYKCILPNTLGERINEVMRRSHPIPWCQCLHTNCNGNTCQHLKQSSIQNP